MDLSSGGAGGDDDGVDALLQELLGDCPAYPAYDPLLDAAAAPPAAVPGAWGAAPAAPAALSPRDLSAMAAQTLAHPRTPPAGELAAAWPPAAGAGGGGSSYSTSRLDAGARAVGLLLRGSAPSAAAAHAARPSPAPPALAAARLSASAPCSRQGSGWALDAANASMGVPAANDVAAALHRVGPGGQAAHAARAPEPFGHTPTHPRIITGAVVVGGIDARAGTLQSVSSMPPEYYRDTGAWQAAHAQAHARAVTQSSWQALDGRTPASEAHAWPAMHSPPAPVSTPPSKKPKHSLVRSQSSPTAGTGALGVAGDFVSAGSSVLSAQSPVPSNLQPFSMAWLEQGDEPAWPTTVHSASMPVNRASGAGGVVAFSALAAADAASGSATGGAVSSASGSGSPVGAESSAGVEAVSRLLAAAASQAPECVGLSKPPQPNGKAASSNYRGVTYHRRTSRWEAHIWCQGRQQYLGGFSFAREAATAYDCMAIHLRGDKASTNFVASVYAPYRHAIGVARKEDLLMALRRHSRIMPRVSKGERSADDTAGGSTEETAGGSVDEVALPPNVPMPPESDAA